jgi:hypothetical protein
VRRRRRRPPPGLYFGVAAALGIALAAAVTTMIIRAASDHVPRRAAGTRPAADGAAPSVYSDSVSTRVFTVIDRRAADARPLTAGEVFPKAAAILPDKDAGARLELAGTRLDVDCAKAIWGVRLGDELRRAGCTQVARGAYVDRKAGYAALITIINLATVADANRVVDSLGNNSPPGFVLPLPAGDRFDQGFSLARGRAMGHYAVISWVRRRAGTGDEQDEHLLSVLVTVGGPKAVIDRAAAGSASED